MLAWCPGSTVQPIGECAEARLVITLLAYERVVRPARDRVRVEGRLPDVPLERPKSPFAAQLTEDQREVRPVCHAERRSVTRLERPQPPVGERVTRREAFQAEVGELRVVLVDPRDRRRGRIEGVQIANEGLELLPERGLLPYHRGQSFRSR